MQEQPLQPEQHTNLSASRAYEIVTLALNAQSANPQSLNFALRNDNASPEILASLLRTAIRVVLENSATYCSAGGYIPTGPHQLRRSIPQSQLEALESATLEPQTTTAPPQTISAERRRALNNSWTNFRDDDSDKTKIELRTKGALQDREERNDLPPVYM